MQTHSSSSTARSSIFSPSHPEVASKFFLQSISLSLSLSLSLASWLLRSISLSRLGRVFRLSRKVPLGLAVNFFLLIELCPARVSLVSKAAACPNRRSIEPRTNETIFDDKEKFWESFPFLERGKARRTVSHLANTKG